MFMKWHLLSRPFSNLQTNVSCCSTGYPVLTARPLVQLEVTEIVNTTEKEWNLLCSVQTVPGEVIDYQIDWLINDIPVLHEEYSRNDSTVFTLESRLASHYFDNITYVDQVSEMCPYKYRLHILQPCWFFKFHQCLNQNELSICISMYIHAHLLKIQ